MPDTTPLGPTDAPADLQELAADPLDVAELHTNIVAGSAEAADVALTAEPTATYVVQAGTFGDVRNARAVLDKIQGLEPHAARNHYHRVLRRKARCSAA